MPKNNVYDFDTTAANNTDIASINIAEGMAPSDVNNAIRALMALIKAGVAYYDSTGALVVTNDITANKSGGVSLSLQDGVGSKYWLSVVGSTLRIGGTGNTIPSSGALNIDAAGNLLLGKTATGNTTNGSEASTSGYRVVAGTNAAAYFYNLNSGTTGTAALFRVANTDVGSITVNATTTAYNTSSDMRLKQDIEDAPEQGERIDAIQVREFAFKAEPDKRVMGFIAQELAEVVPDAVTQGNMWGVDFSKLVPLLVKEVQSLRARVAELEAR